MQTKSKQKATFTVHFRFIFKYYVFPVTKKKTCKEGISKVVYDYFEALTKCLLVPPILLTEAPGC